MDRHPVQRAVRRGCAGSPAGTARTWSWIPWTARSCTTACAASPTGAGASASARPGAARLSCWISRRCEGSNQALITYFLGTELAAGSRAHERIAALLADVAGGALRVIIERTYPLADAAAAHAYAESPAGAEYPHGAFEDIPLQDGKPTPPGGPAHRHAP